MPRQNLIKRREQQVAKQARNRHIASGYVLPKGWHKTKVANLSKMKKGDMVLTVSRRHTLGGVFSRTVAKLTNGEFAHVGAYFGKENGRPLVRDFKGRKGHRKIEWSQFAKTGVDLKVVRWKGATDQQMAEFIHNLQKIPKIGKWYDFPQAVGYTKWLQLFKFDLEKFFTCSEYLSTAGSPNKKEIDKYGLRRPKPPLLFHPTMSPEMVTPAVIDAAVKSGILEVVTEQKWQKHQ